jgi:hypothetical protein
MYRVLESSHELCLGLEPPDERRVVGELGTDHLDRDFAADRRLVRAVRDAERADPDLLAQLVAADRRAESACVGDEPCTARIERLVADDDLVVYASKADRRFYTELFTESRRDHLVRPQCFGLPTAPVRREHPALCQPFTERMLPHERFELGDQLLRETAGEVDLDARLDHLEPQLLEPRDLPLGGRLVRELLERSAAPHRQGFAEHDRRGAGIASHERAAFTDEVFEPPRVDVVRSGLDEVARRPCHEHRGVVPRPTPGLERLSEARDVDPERVLAIGPGLSAPERVDDPVGREHHVRIGEQQREAGSLPERTDVHRASVSYHLELAEDPELHGVHPRDRPYFRWSASMRLAT